MANTHKWSITSVNTLRSCNRKYYFSSVLANYSHSNKLKRKAFELKQMQNLTMWPGSVVDKIMELHLIPMINEGDEIDFDELAEMGVNLAKKQFDFSEQKIYYNKKATKTVFEEDYCILDIHELGKEYSELEITQAYDKIRTSILNIPSIKLPGSEKILIDYLYESIPRLPNVTKWSFQIENSRVAPQMDLIIYHNGKPVVIDWKVSDSYISDYSRQLIICGLTVYFTRLKKVSDGKAPYQYSDIKLYEVNLLKGEMKEHLFTEERANELIDQINLTGTDIELLRKDLTDKIEDINNFDLTEDEHICATCNFRELCKILLLNNNNYDETALSKPIQNQELKFA